ncbi:hypothetical protein ACWKW6_12270 [Dyadobacter jiangsuensis]
MNILKRLAGCVFLLTALVGCTTRDEAIDAEKYWEGLNDNQARIIANIGGKPFYSNESLFSGQVIMSENVLNVTLTDQFDGRTIINLAGDKWYGRRPVSDRVESYEQSATSLKIGKIIDREKLIGEGFMLTKGDIVAVTFEKSKMVFKIRGEVAKYSDFRKPDQYLPFECLVVYKKPAISLGDISEQAIFGTTHSN